jgi:hypothetical protein
MLEIKTIAEAEARIREACIEANPALRELSFGCWIEIDGFLRERVTAIRSVGGVKMAVTDVTREWWPVDRVRVLGRDPQISDLLPALHKFQPNRYYSLSVRGELVEVRHGKRTIHAYLDLTKPLSDQSDGFKLLLAALLKENR